MTRLTIRTWQWGILAGWVWIAVLVTVATTSPTPTLFGSLLGSLLLFIVGQWRLALGGATLATTATLATMRKIATVAAHSLRHATDITIEGRLLTGFRTIGHGRFLYKIHPLDLPCELPVITGKPPTMAAGTTLAITAEVQHTDRLNLCPILLNETHVEPVAPPGKLLTAAATLHEHLLGALTRLNNPTLEALAAGMIIGDTSQVTPEAQLRYTATGLSHLTAVSGANVAIVTTSVLVIAKAIRLPQWLAVGIAGLALIAYVLLVGTEPSVLRAAATGSIGLLALIGDHRLHPARVLAATTIGLLVYDPQLACAYGFALSVAATAGILLIYPHLIAPLVSCRIPLLFAKAIALAIAAQLITAPLITLMAGQFSTVSVVANLLAAPAVAPITVAGLVLVLTASWPLIPQIIVWLLQLPLRWIDAVARTTSTLPLATITIGDDLTGVIQIITVGLWIVLLCYSRWAATLTVAAAFLLGSWTLVTLIAA
ncbi:ComEC/Rec2 family competence protein [Corynebacterium choanae]|uniref:ComEC family competence protein n=1 Tax=Corynebacterium choanae TaxID=1862358 RepID=A0A3G6J8K1_9CORY|nr:ComEC/Rec2 family competence protein [Corynebacterium choanae]AZA14103.1 ComEC family competence protein [Corynebacterium choanae]